MDHLEWFGFELFFLSRKFHSFFDVYTNFWKKFLKIFTRWIFFGTRQNQNRTVKTGFVLDFQDVRWSDVTDITKVDHKREQFSGYKVADKKILLSKCQNLFFSWMF